MLIYKPHLLSSHTMYNCFDIAHQFLLFAQTDNRSVDTMKLLKLTYIAHGWYLGFNGKPLFKNEVQAWKHGPVIPDLYHVIKRYGVGTVSLDIIALYTENKLVDEDVDFLNSIWEAYKDSSGLELSSRTHKKNTPWHKSYETGVPNILISNHDIKCYYESKINSTQQVNEQ